MVNILAAMPEAGGYIHPVKLLVMVVGSIPWLYLAPWVYQHARRIPAMPAPLLSAVVLAAGGIGMILWLVLPVYWAGLVVYLLLLLASLMSYVAYHDSKVVSENKILTVDGMRRVFAKPKKFEVITRVKLYETHLGGKIVPVPSTETHPLESCVIYNFVQEFLENMLIKRASQVDIAPASPHEVVVRFVIDGVVTNEPPISLEESEAFIQYIKKVADLKVEDRRHPQQGHVMIDFAGKSTDVTVNVAGTTGGQRVRFKITLEMVQTKLEELGFDDDILNKVIDCNSRQKGIILVSGKPASGVTSTLYSLLRKQDAFLNQLVSCEAKPAIDLENVTQNTYESTEQRAEVLQAMVRRAPDVIMVDRCDDPETARTIVNASERHLIIAGIPAGDSFSALAKWVKMLSNPGLSMKNLMCVTYQVLVRKLCEGCKEAYRPDPSLLAKANLSADGVDCFFRQPKNGRVDEKGNPIVCPVCQEAGYMGRTGVFELLEISDELRDVVSKGDSLSQIKATARKSGMLYCQELALRKVSAGITSVQEVIRATQPATSASKQQKK